MCRPMPVFCCLPSLQFLCCEVATLQLAGQLRALQLFDVAHMAWRLQVACEARAAIDALGQVSQLACSQARRVELAIG